MSCPLVEDRYSSSPAGQDALKEQQHSTTAVCLCCLSLCAVACGPQCGLGLADQAPNLNNQDECSGAANSKGPPTFCASRMELVVKTLSNVRRR